MSNLEPIMAIGAARDAASDALTSSEAVIRNLCHQGDTHREFLTELGMRCCYDHINGIRYALEGYRAHLPQEWFDGEQLRSFVLLGFRLITGEGSARNIVWVWISEELGEDFGDVWFIDHDGVRVPETEIRVLFTQEGTHNEFLTEIGVRSEIGDETGIRRAVEANREHFPTVWFNAGGQLKENILEGFGMDNGEHSFVWAIIAGELGANFGNQWFNDHFAEIRALFSDEEWAEAVGYARETFGYVAADTEDEAGSN